MRSAPEGVNHDTSFLATAIKIPSYFLSAPQTSHTNMLTPLIWLRKRYTPIVSIRRPWIALALVWTSSPVARTTASPRPPSLCISLTALCVVLAAVLLLNGASAQTKGPAGAVGTTDAAKAPTVILRPFEVTADATYQGRAGVTY